MPPNAVESGIKDLRAHFIREVNAGVTPANPDWLRYGDTIMELPLAPNMNPYMLRGVGNFDVQAFFPGPEDHELSMTYFLQNWFVDGSGNPADAAGDGLLRASDGGFLNTHSALFRQELITGGTLDSGVRIYTVCKGGRVGSVSLEGEPDTGEPLRVGLNYVFEKMRSYRIDQPSASSTVDIVSTDAADTTQTVTVESEGGGVSEDIALNGTTEVNGVTSFTDIDSISVDAETEGDIVISIGGTEICRILGKTSNGGYAGDLGIPPLGTGSFETELGTDYEFILGSSVQRGGSDLEGDSTIRTFSMTVDNQLDVHPQVTSRLRRIIPGVRDISANASIFSAVGSHESFVEHIKLNELDLVWTIVSGSLTLTGTILNEMGARTYRAGNAVMQRNNVFVGKGISISNAV